MNIIKLKEIESTNEYIKNINNKENYTLVISERQTNGKGRRGNAWVSQKGGAYFSFLIKASDILSISEYQKLSLVTGISLLKYLESITNLDFKFKWTNDIYIKNKKLAGILIEKNKEHYIIGIGINVNNDVSSVNNKAISLKEVDNIIRNTDLFIIKYIKYFKIFYNMFLKNKWKNIYKEIKKYDYLEGKVIKIDGIKYKSFGIEKSGQLLIEKDNKKTLINIGEIHISETDLEE